MGTVIKLYHKCVSTHCNVCVSGYVVAGTGIRNAYRRLI